MAIIKLSSSGKQVQFITDEGKVYGTSLTFLKGLFEGKSKSGFLLLTRMPYMVSKDRFKPSPVWNPESGEKEYSDEEFDDLNKGVDKDSLSHGVIKKAREREAFKDKKVW